MEDAVDILKEIRERLGRIELRVEHADEDLRREFDALKSSTEKLLYSIATTENTHNSALTQKVDRLETTVEDFVRSVSQMVGALERKLDSTIAEMKVREELRVAQVAHVVAQERAAKPSTDTSPRLVLSSGVQDQTPHPVVAVAQRPAVAAVGGGSILLGIVELLRYLAT